MKLHDHFTGTYVLTRKWKSQHNEHDQDNGKAVSSAKRRRDTNGLIKIGKKISLNDFHVEVFQQLYFTLLVND